MKTSINVVFLTIALAIACPASADKIVRHCDAAFEMEQNLPRPGGDQRITIERFSAGGSCGRSEPDRCRERARDKAHRCMRAHFERKSSRPAECRDNAIQGYELNDLTQRVGAEACGRYQAACRKAECVSSKTGIKLYAVTTGDRKCPKQVVLFDDSFDCDKL